MTQIIDDDSMREAGKSLIQLVAQRVAKLCLQLIAPMLAGALT